MALKLNVVIPSARQRISWGKKIQAVKMVARDGVEVKKAVSDAYIDSDVEKEPKNPSMTMRVWCKQIQDAIDGGNAAVIELAKAAGIVEDREDNGEEEEAAPKKRGPGRPKR